MSVNSDSAGPSDNNIQNGQPHENEADLHLKIEKYETLCKSNSEKLTQLENDLKKKDNDIVNFKKRVAQLEDQLTEAQKFKAQHVKESDEVQALKERSEDTLTRAKSIIFEKTKVIKNQELQMEALNQQISSLKDVVSITKDLLEIRNLEIKQLETKIQCMEDKIGAEKERHDLMHKKLEHMIRYNGDLKREYETQLCLFSALRERYNERELAKGVINDLRADVQTARNAASSSAGTTASNSATNSAGTTASNAVSNGDSSSASGEMNGNVEENTETKEE